MPSDFHPSLWVKLTRASRLRQIRHIAEYIVMRLHHAHTRMTIARYKIAPGNTSLNRDKHKIEKGGKLNENISLVRIHFYAALMVCFVRISETR